MSTPKNKFYPGWKMTRDQWGTYWRLIGQVCHAQGVKDAAGREEVRKMIHLRAFTRPVSAKDIDHLKMFDDFKAACLAILKPNDLNAQLAQANMEKTQFIHRIKELAPELYWRAEAMRKFGTEDLERLSVDDLTMLRNHLQARASEIVWPASKCELRPGIGLCDSCSLPKWPQEHDGYGSMICLDCIEAERKKPEPEPVNDDQPF
jgi:hypothetical protein